MILALLVGGCATKVDWGARVGIYTYDRVVTEYGPPDKYAKLTDGVIIADWLTRRGHTHYAPFGYGPWYYGPYYGPMEMYSPDYFLRLTFAPDGLLREWKRYAK